MRDAAAGHRARRASRRGRRSEWRDRARVLPRPGTDGVSGGSARDPTDTAAAVRAQAREHVQALNRLAFSLRAGYHTRALRAMSMSGKGQPPRAWVEVAVDALIDNARTIARVSGTRLLPVVKANAYGVGAVLASKALEPLDPWGYGVATIEEGAELRAAGITRPILVFMPTRAQLFAEYERHRLTPALGDAGSILEWTTRGDRPFHVEIDTGMGRAGVRWDEVDELGEAVDTASFEGCFTHFHSAERRDGTAEQQLERFLGAVARLPRRPALLHVANSAAALRGKQFAFDLVRPGIFLYGGAPAGGLPEPRPAGSVRARVLGVRRIRRGGGVGYDAR